jgi:hypothetical protein
LRKYTLNENFFENIDSEEKAYWLGFISADGCINRNRHGNYIYLSVALNNKDHHHLELLGKSLGYGGPVKDYDDYSKLVVSSRQITDSLKSLGVTERKSLIIKPWRGPADLMSHYWRGVFDGDGILSPSSNWQAGLCGSNPMVQGFYEFSNDYVKSKAIPKLIPSRDCWRWQVHGRNISSKMIQPLYENYSIALNRKASLASELMG